MAPMLCAFLCVLWLIHTVRVICHLAAVAIIYLVLCDVNRGKLCVHLFEK